MRSQVCTVKLQRDPGLGDEGLEVQAAHLPSDGGLLDGSIAQRVIARTLRRGGRFAELFVENRTGLALSLDDRKVEQAHRGLERGSSIRLQLGDSTYFGYVDSWSEEELMRLADSVSQAAAEDSREPAALDTVRWSPGHTILRRPEVVPVDRKAELLRSCDEVARQRGPEVQQVTASYAESRRQVEIFNSEGLAAGDDRTRVRLSVQVIAGRDGRLETGSETRGGHAGFELIELDPEQVAFEAARKALTALDAIDAPSGKMPVVVGNGFGGVLLHEAVGHGLEADAVQKGASVYAGRIGEKLAPDFVNAFDDGRKPNAWGSDGLDDEGAPTQKVPIIESGVLNSFLYDRLRAERDGKQSTGNGRRESFRSLPIPRMTNTYFAPGERSPDELIGSIKKGLYAVSFGGGQVEPATGDFVFGVSEAYLIENGAVASPVRGVTLVGNGLEALQAIEGIADDLEIASGYCGKAGQRVPAGVGQPHVLLREMTVGGTAA